jgi:N-acetylneuraminic acid mutarotase
MDRNESQPNEKGEDQDDENDEISNDNAQVNENEKHRPRHESSNLTSSMTNSHTLLFTTSDNQRLVMQQQQQQQQRRRQQASSKSNRSRRRNMHVSGSQALLRASAPTTCASFVKRPSYETQNNDRLLTSRLQQQNGNIHGNIHASSPNSRLQQQCRQNYQIQDEHTLLGNMIRSSLRDHIIIDTQAPVPSAAPSTLLVKRPLETKGTWLEVEVDTTSSSPPPSARSLHTASMWNDCMFVFGGFDGVERRNDMHVFNFTTKTWRLVDNATGSPPTPRDRHSSVVYRNCLYIFGGFDGHARTNDLYQFDIETSHWTQILPSTLESTIPTPRHSHSAIVYNDNMIVYGGYDGGYRSDLHKYSFSTNTWTRLDPSGRSPRPRYRATCVVHRDQCYLHGGHDGTRHLMDTHVYDFLKNSWRQVEAKGTPPIHRDSHVSVIYADSMIVFGGATGGTAMCDMHELVLDRPGDDSEIPVWRPITCIGTASQRFCHSGVIYGDSLFILGGFNGTQRLGDFIKFEFNLDDLSYEVPESTMSSDMKLLINNDTFSDITFVVEGFEIRAHKIMLIRSSYFRAMLTGSMIEAGQPVIYIEEVSYDIFLKVLEYLYTDKVEVQFEDAMDLFAAADLFDVPRLKAICEKTMLEKICIENAASVFHAADAHSAAVLREKSLHYIVQHFEPISKTLDFEEMARSNVELVVEILRNR